MTEPEIVLLSEREEAVFLAIDAAVPAGTRQELRDWAREDLDPSGGTRGLDATLSVEGLLMAATSGVVGNAAWSIFPAAARWLSERFRSDDGLSIQDIVERMRNCLTAFGVAQADLVIGDLHQDREGRWLGGFRHDGVRYRVTADAAGHILRVRRDDGPR